MTMLEFLSHNWVWMLAVALSVIAIPCFTRANYARNHSDDFEASTTIKRWIVAGVFILAAVGFWIGFAIQSNNNQGDTGRFPSTTASPSPSASATPTASPSPSPSAEPDNDPYDPENDFPLIDIDEIRRDDFRAEFPDHIFSGNSLWDRGDERITAIKAAMKAAGKSNKIINDLDAGKTSTHGMGDAVNFPITKLTEKLKEINSGKLSEDELEALYAEVMHDLEAEIIKNPAMGEMFLKGFSKVPSIMKLNGDAITEMLKMFEDARERTSDPIGLSYWLRGDAKDPTKVYVSDEYVDVIARYVIITLRHCEANGITVRTSTHNWVLVTDGNTKDNTINALAYPDEADYQESQEALLLVYYGKETERVAMGINIWDQRLEIYEPTQPKPDPSTEPSDPPPSNSIPPDRRTQLYSLTVHHRVVGASADWKTCTETNKYQAGSQYTHNVDNYDGYNVIGVDITCKVGSNHSKDLNSWVSGQSKISGTFKDHNIDLTIWYEKIPEKNSLTVHHVDEATGFNVLADYFSGKVYAVNQAYTYSIPQKDGYTVSKVRLTCKASGVVHTLDLNAWSKGSTTISGTFKGHNIDVTIYYVASPRPSMEPGKRPNDQYVGPGGGGDNDNKGPGGVQVSSPPEDPYVPPVSTPAPENTPAVVPPSGGQVDNGDAPPTDPLPVPSTTVIDPNSGQTVDPGSLPDGGDMEIPT